MATRIETLGGGRRVPRAAWITLFAIVMVAAAIAIGTLVRSDGASTEPARPATSGATQVEPATQVPGLIKAGLQPRPFSRIPVVKGETVEKVPDGFVRMPSGELRPRSGA